MLLAGVIFLGNASPAKVGEDVSVTKESRKAEWSKYVGLENNMGKALGSGGILGVCRCALTERPPTPPAPRDCVWD